VSELEKLNCLKRIFNELFLATYNTCLSYGHSEPFYKAARNGEPAEIQSREDFLSSALHEIAHWCIAGSERRRLDDFGYWYEPDGRSEEQQIAFEQVEVKPQAVEWCLALAMNHLFHFSADNLGGRAGPSEWFKHQVHQQAALYWQHGLPPRAQILFEALIEQFCGGVKPEPPFNSSESPLSCESSRLLASDLAPEPQCGL
jgi:hypothetical protein